MKISILCNVCNVVLIERKIRNFFASIYYQNLSLDVHSSHPTFNFKLFPSKSSSKFESLFIDFNSLSPVHLLIEKNQVQCCKKTVIFNNTQMSGSIKRRRKREMCRVRTFFNKIDSLTQKFCIKNSEIS